MIEFHFPWIQLAILVPALGAVWTGRSPTLDSTHRRAVWVSGAALLLALAEALDYARMESFEVHAYRDLTRQLFSWDGLVVDALSAPLLPLAALVYWVTILATPLIVVPDLVLGIFLHDPAIVALARQPMMLVGMGFILDAVGIVLINALLGAGASRQVMAISIALQWLLFLPLAWLVGLQLGYGLMGIWLCFAGYRLIQALIFASLWEAAKWQTIRV